MTDLPDLITLPFWDATLRFQRLYVESALERAGGVTNAAARLACVERSNFRRLLDRHGLRNGKASDG